MGERPAPVGGGRPTGADRSCRVRSFPPRLGSDQTRLGGCAVPSLTELFLELTSMMPATRSEARAVEARRAHTRVSHAGPVAVTTTRAARR